MSLRVVVPPHPLIGHWLTLLRDRDTPAALFATAMAELGRWLTYEALRDWLPQRPVTVETSLASCRGLVVDNEVPLLSVLLLRGGLGLWQGAQDVLPSGQVAHVGLENRGLDQPLHWYLDDLPSTIPERMGVLLFLPQLVRGNSLLAVLERLEALGVSGDRLRVITAVASAPGLKAVAERFSWLTLYCACVDPELDLQGHLLPGFGNVTQRLFGTVVNPV